MNCVVIHDAIELLRWPIYTDSREPVLKVTGSRSDGGEFVMSNICITARESRPPEIRASLKLRHGLCTSDAQNITCALISPISPMRRLRPSPNYMKNNC